MYTAGDVDKMLNSYTAADVDKMLKSTGAARPAASVYTASEVGKMLKGYDIRTAQPVLRDEYNKFPDYLVNRDYGKETAAATDKAAVQEKNRNWLQSLVDRSANPQTAASGILNNSNPQSAIADSSLNKGALGALGGRSSVNPNTKKSTVQNFLEATNPLKNVANTMVYLGNQADAKAAADETAINKLAGLNQRALTDPSVLSSREYADALAKGSTVDLLGQITKNIPDDMNTFKDVADIMNEQSARAASNLLEGKSGAAKVLTDAALTAGDMIGTSGVAAMTGVPYLTLVSAYSGSDAGQRALDNGERYDKAALSAIGSGAITYATEAFGGIAGIWGNKSAQRLAATAIGQKVLSAVPKKIADKIAAFAASRLGKIAGDAASEWTEEMAEYYAQAFFNNLLLDNDIPTDIKEALYQAGIAGLVGGAYGAVNASFGMPNNAKGVNADTKSDIRAMADQIARQAMQGEIGAQMAQNVAENAQNVAEKAQNVVPSGQNVAENTANSQTIGNFENSPAVNGAVKANTSLFDSSILQNLNLARTAFIRYAAEHFPKSAVNRSTGKEIGISRKGLDKLLSGNISFEKYASAFHVPELIENATKVTEANNYHPETKNQIPTYEYYDSPISVDGKEYKAHIRVKNTMMGDKYYGHTLSEIDDIKIEPSARTFPKNAGVQLENAIEDSINPIIPQGGNEVNTSIPQNAANYSGGAIEQTVADKIANDVKALQDKEKAVQDKIVNDVKTLQDKQQAAFDKIEEDFKPVQVKGLNSRIRRVLKATESRLGVNIEYDKTLRGDNGYYDPNTRTIHIAADSADPIGVVLTHEITHRMKETSPELYQNFKNTVFGLMQENGSFERVRNTVANTYADPNVIEDEMLAHFTRNIVEDIDSFEQLVGVNRNLAQKLYDYLSEIINKIAWDGDRIQDDLFGDMGYGQLQRTREAWRVMLDKADAAAQGSGAQQRMVNPNFAAEYDAWDKKTGNGYFNIGSTSAALQSIGINPSNIYWDKSKIKKIKLEHPEMTDSIIKQVPQMLENPVIVMQSQTVKNRVVALGEVYADGKPVLCALELRPDGRIDNLIKVASAYGKNGVQTLLNNSDILYIEPNKNRTDNWLKALGLQLPSAQTNYGSIGRVTYYDDVVNSQPQPTKTAMQAAFEKASANVQYMQNGADNEQVMKSKPLTSLKRQFEPHPQPEGVNRDSKESAIKHLGEEGAFDNVKQLLDEARDEQRVRKEADKGGIASIATPEELKQRRKNALDIIEGLSRKVIDSGERIDKIGKAVGDDVLYAMFNNARQARSAAMNDIGVAQTDLMGNRVGKSIADIVSPIKQKGSRYWDAFQLYLYHMHNIDSMTLATRGVNIIYGRIKAIEAANPALAGLDADGVKELRKNPKYREACNKWLALERRMETIRNKPVFGNDMTAEDSRDIVNTLLMAYPEMESEAKEVIQYYQNMMNDNVTAGLISAEERSLLAELYPHYVPVMTNTLPVAGERQSSRAAVEDIHKSRKHNNRQLLPIDEAMARKTLSSIAAQKRNLFGIRLLEHALTERDKIGRDVQSIYDSDMMYDMDAEDLPRLDNKFSVWVDGAAADMAVSPELMEGIRSMIPKPSDGNYAAELCAGAINIFKKSVTSWNPFFGVTNAIKDFQDALLYTEQGIGKFVSNYGRAYKEIATNGEYWQLYQNLGGVGNSYFNYGDGVDLPNSRGIKKLTDKLEAINLAIEQAPRLSEFIGVVEKGGRGYENMQKALLAAADITVNFGRNGEVGKNINRYAVPFFNPGIQGANKWFRALCGKESKKAFALLIAKAFAAGMLPALFNEIMYRDDDEYKILTNSVKDNYYLIKYQNGIWFRIPKGRALMPFANLAQRGYRQLRGDKDAFDGYIESSISAVAPNNPFTENFLTPWFEADLFDPDSPGKTWYGGDIESKAMQSLKPGDRTDEYTSSLANAIGKTLNLSPKKINHIIDAYSGVLGDVILPLTAPAATGAYPLIDRFYTNSTFKNRLSADYYQALDDATREINSTPTPGAYAQKDALNEYSKDISDLNKQIHLLQNSDMPKKEKLSQVKEVRRELNDTYKEALDAAEQARREIEQEFEDIPDKVFQRAVLAYDSAIKDTVMKNGKEQTVPLSLDRNRKKAIDEATPELNYWQRKKIYEILGINKKVW